MRGRAAAALLVVALAGCGADADRRVTGPVLSVYASVPLAGPSAAVGRDVLDGERLALAEIRGRVRGHRIRLVTLDSADPEERRTTPARVAVNARRAARDPSTVAYLGEVDPAASAVSVVILNEQGILQLSPADTFSGLTERAGGLTGGPARFYPTHHRTFARLVPDDTVLSAALVERLRRQGTRRLALLDDDGIYGRSLIGEVAARAVREGLRVVARLRVDPRARRPIAGLVARLRAGRPDAVLFGAEPAPGLPALWRALHTALPRARLVAPAALAVPRFYTGLGAAAPHTELVTPALPPAALGPATPLPGPIPPPLRTTGRAVGALRLRDDADAARGAGPGRVLPRPAARRRGGPGHACARLRPRSLRALRRADFAHDDRLLLGQQGRARAPRAPRPRGVACAPRSRYTTEEGVQDCEDPDHHGARGRGRARGRPGRLRLEQLGRRRR